MSVHIHDGSDHVSAPYNCHTPGIVNQDLGSFRFIHHTKVPFLSSSVHEGEVGSALHRLPDDDIGCFRTILAVSGRYWLFQDDIGCFRTYRLFQDDIGVREQNRPSG